MGMFKVAVDEGVASGADAAALKTLRDHGMDEAFVRSLGGWRGGSARAAHRALQVDDRGIESMLDGGLLGGLGGAAAGYGLSSQVTDNPKLRAAAAVISGLGGAGLGGYVGRRVGRALGEGDLAVEEARILDNPNLSRAEIAHPLNQPGVRGVAGGLGGAALGALLGGAAYDSPRAGAAVGGLLGAAAGYVPASHRRALVEELLAQNGS